MELVFDAAGVREHWGAVFVPTMGALHAGHVALIEHGAAVARGAGVVVSIFVNPTQFGDPTDYSRYPRALEADVEIARAAGATCVFAPAPEVVYPPGETVPVPELPAAATAPGLEDAQRPGHFAGVCQVVSRLFELVRPRAAVFGEKDWQQLQVVRALARAQGRGVEITGRPTVREADGLALSSRNRFLNEDERKRATEIVRALRAAAGEETVAGAERAMRERLRAAGIGVDYAVVRDAETLMVAREGRAKRALVAGRLGSVRLLDNAEWGEAVGSRQ